MNKHNVLLITDNENYKDIPICNYSEFNIHTKINNSPYDTGFDNFNQLLNQLLKCDSVIIDSENQQINNKLK